jgi:hypothetical protein
LRLIKTIYFENSLKNRWNSLTKINSVQANIICFSFYSIIFLFFNPLFLNLLSQTIALQFI